MKSNPIFEICVNGQVTTNSGKEAIENWRRILERNFASLHSNITGKSKLSVELQFWLGPKRIYRMKRNDLDNLSKPVLDAMKRIGIIHDDSQIFHLEVSKSHTKGEEGVHVKVKELIVTTRP